MSRDYVTIFEGFPDIFGIQRKSNIDGCTVFKDAIGKIEELYKSNFVVANKCVSEQIELPNLSVTNSRNILRTELLDAD